MHQLTNLEITGACVILMLGLLAIVLMIACGFSVVAEEAIKEARREAEHRAQVLAERKYRRMLENTEYRVRVGMRIVDEMEGE